MREMGRRSEAAEHPYKRLPGDDGGKATGWPEPGMVSLALPCSPAQAGAQLGTVSASREPRMTGPRPSPGNGKGFGEGPAPSAKERRPGSNDPGATVKEVAAFFDTARSTSTTVSRVCPPTTASLPLTSGDGAPPLVTVHKVGSRVEVAAASRAALALGITPGMPLTQVRAAVPDVVVRDADFDGDARELRKLGIALARRWTPVVAVADARTLFLDLTGVSHLHGGEEAMARRLVRLLARLGFTARIAVADTVGAAWACAHFAPSSITLLPPGDPLPALGPLPVAALRVEERAQDLLRRLGVETVGQLAALPRAPLVRRFGRTLALRLDQAAGRASEPLDAIVPPVAIMVEQRFAEPLLTAEPIAHWIGQLVTRLAVDLARAGRGARTVVLAATRIDRAVQTIRIGFARPTRAPDHMLRLLVRQVDRLDPGFGIEALALHVQRADPLGAEALDGDLADGERPDLAPLVDAIVNRIGQRRLWRMTPVESDVPERGVAHTAPLDPAADTAPRLTRDDVRHLDTRAPAHPWHPRWARPARLLRRPEPLDHVMAEMPDYPPARFTWRGITHRVVRGDGPERITGEWWRRQGEASAVRDYFRVEDEAGARFWLFRRGDGLRAETGDLSWYIHGTFG